MSVRVDRGTEAREQEREQEQGQPPASKRARTQPPEGAGPQGIRNKGEQPVHAAPPCECGTCGACAHDVDVLPKEVKGPWGPQAQAIARRLEQQSGPFVPDTQSSESIHGVTDALKEWERYVREERAHGVWKLEEDEEETGTDEQQAQGAKQRGAPPREREKLRFVIKEVKKQLRANRDARQEARGLAGKEEVCAFCRRKGHEIKRCLVRPPWESEKRRAAATEETRARDEWVERLLARETRKWHTTEVEDKLKFVQEVMEKGEEANRGNPWAHSEERRDKLRKALGYWWAIGADKSVLAWIGYGVRLKFEEEPGRKSFPNHKSYHDHVEHVEAEHVKHVAAGSFREVAASEVHVGNPLQVEVNAKGKKRMCSDDRYANAFMADYTFTQEGLRHVAELVRKGDTMITTDVEQAYYQVPLHEDSQKYCGWQHAGKWYVPTILVFGLKTAPFIFTKIMRPVLQFVRMLGISGTNCIDDNLWAAIEASMRKEVLPIVQLVFGKLGWVFNSKCVLEPSTVALYNGMWIDSKRYEIRAPDEKWERARKLAWTLWFRARDGEQVLVNDLQVLTGVLQSIKLAVEGVDVWTRGIYADVNGCVQHYRRQDRQQPPKDAVTHLGETAMEDLWFWATRLSQQRRYNGQPIKGPGTIEQVTVNSDAGDLGYGMHATAEEGGDQWEISGALEVDVLGESSTARELTGLIRAAAGTVDKLRGKSVCFRMDSYPAIRNLIRGGGPKMQLNLLVREWWLWCAEHKVRASYLWVERERNTLADELSKVVAQQHTLREGVEKRVREWLTGLGEPGMGKCEWARTAVYVPLLEHVGKRMEELRRRRKPACIIIPVWPSAPWWPLVKENTCLKKCLRLGTAAEVIVGQVGSQQDVWRMEARLVEPGDD